MLPAVHQGNINVKPQVYRVPATTCTRSRKEQRPEAQVVAPRALPHSLLFAYHPLWTSCRRLPCAAACRPVHPAPACPLLPHLCCSSRHQPASSGRHLHCWAQPSPQHPASQKRSMLQQRRCVWSHCDLLPCHKQICNLDWTSSSGRAHDAELE